MKDYCAIALGYAQSVVRGETPACQFVKMACQRHLDDLEKQSLVVWNYRFDEELGNRVCAFIEGLRHTKGQWARRRETLLLEPWQCFVLVVPFGWVHKETGLRRFTDVYIEVPRKNAKSTLTSGVALYMLVADDEPGAEVYAAATTHKQARLVFDDSRRMAMLDSEFCHHFGVEIEKHQLLVDDTNSKFVPLAAEGSTLDGLNVHFAAIDELHAHKSRELYDVIDSGRGSREQPMIWAITTAGTNRSGICYERRSHVIKVLKGIFVDESTFGIVFTIDDGDDWTDPAVWAKANPNFGVSVLPEDMERASRYAMSMASKQPEFLTKRLNVWVNADHAWMDMRAWDACADDSLSLTDFEGERCIIGLDLASKIDIAAKIYLFERKGTLYLFGQYWLPERAVEESGNSQYQGWAIEGLLNVSPGEVTDYDDIEQSILDDKKRFDLAEVGFDPFQATQLSSHLIDQFVPMVEVKPTVLNFSEPMKELEARVLAGKLRHNGCPILTWMVSNVVCHTDAKDNIYPRKERPENKIDGVVAALTALNRFMAGENDYTSTPFQIL
ncbi:MAG TPA: terminase TerL endonuclease subunit [Limnobacter sp.]|uniref:terminase large subunit n=1 Tax=Limnobacter sp. TaxID=2003368 RepID=UPI002E325497|nr:terminase TerL endonuclease subunit [Limnobacter sp.]HEX5486508.1 terminase TerL endonuclease subunit [Limnobacter sp.]